MVAHTDVLAKYGPEKIMAAAEDEAEWVGDVEEIGTSDVSISVKRVIQSLEEQNNVTEGPEQRWRVTVGNKSGTLSHTKVFTGTKEQAIKQAVTRFATTRNPVVTAELVKQDVKEATDGIQTILSLLKDFALTREEQEDRKTVAGIYKAFQQGMEPGFTALFNAWEFDIDSEFYYFARNKGIDLHAVADQAGFDTDSVKESSESPESELERLKLRQNAWEKAPLRDQAATQARIRELEKQIKDKENIEEADMNTGNQGYDNMLAVMKAVDAGQDATFNLAGEPITLEYPEARFLAGKYKAFLRAGRQEEFLKYMNNPVAFDRLMKQLRDLIDKQKNFRGSVPGERGVDEAAPAMAKLAGGLGVGLVAAAGAPAIVGILGPLLGIPVAAYGAYSAAKLGMKGVEQLWDMATEKLGSSEEVEQYANAQIAKLPQDQAQAAQAVIKQVAESKKATELPVVAEGHYYCKLSKTAKLIPEGYKKTASGYITRV